MHRHFWMDSRHAQELEELLQRQTQERKDLEAKLAQIDDIDRQIEAFVEEYLPVTDSGKPEPGDTSTVPAEAEVVATWAKTKFGIRRYG